MNLDTIDETKKDEPTPSPFLVSKPSKKSLTKKTKYIIGGTVFVLLIALLTVGLLTAMKPKTTVTASVNTEPAANTVKTPTPVTPLTPTDTTSLMTSSATDESTLTNTDDSSDATDASTTAGTVGSSIDENNF
jgi:hypothetical protein